MKLSTRAIYSFRLMVYLADHAERGNPIKLKDVAEAQGLPFKYLEQLVVALKNTGLIRSVQGKHGGYTLARSADRISALEVLEASMGRIELMECVDSVDCKFREMCASRKMWGLIQSRMSDILSEYSLADLSEKRMLEKFMEATGEMNVRLRCGE